VFIRFKRTGVKDPQRKKTVRVIALQSRLTSGLLGDGDGEDILEILSMSDQMVQPSTSPQKLTVEN
jgi:hypothetical protein